MANPQHATLTANTVSTFTLDWPAHLVEIVNVDGAGSAAVYVSLDGTAPTVAGAGFHVLPGTIGSVEVGPTASGGIRTVKVISSGTPAVSVRVIE